MQARLILYLRGSDLFSGWDDMDGAKKNVTLLSYADSCQGTELSVGGIKVGECNGYRLKPDAVGIIVEWEKHVEVGQLITGGIE